MDLWVKILVAAIFAFMIFRLWPVANHWLKHGPRGTSKDWQGVFFPLLLVIAFIFILVMIVRN